MECMAETKQNLCPLLLPCCYVSTYPQDYPRYPWRGGRTLFFPPLLHNVQIAVASGGHWGTSTRCNRRPASEQCRTQGPHLRRQMMHHRRIAGGGKPHQPSSTGATTSSSGSVERSSKPIDGLEPGNGGSIADRLACPAATADAVVDEMLGDMPAPPGAGWGQRDLLWRQRRSMLQKITLVVVAAGVFVLVLVGERLFNGPSAFARRPLPHSRVRGDDADKGRDTPGLHGGGDGLGGISDATASAAAIAAAAAASWTGYVSGCTASPNGFVYGGDPGKVLTFTRRRRKRGGGDPERYGGGGGGGVGVDSPALPDVLRWFWKLKHDRGVLAYEVSALETRRDVGKKTGWGVFFVSNVGRHKPFPPPGPAEVPWDPSSFNFYRAGPSEFLLSYTPSFRHEREEAAKAAARLGEFGVAAQADTDAVAPGALSVAAAIEEGKAMVSLAALRGVGGEPDRAAAAAAAAAAKTGLESVISVKCGEASTASPPEDAVLVNLRPVGFVSLLLAPGYPHSHNQRAAAESLAVAMDFAEALMADPGFRLGFNSAGSSASVNHLHFQCWYFDAGPGGLAIEAAKTMHTATVPLRRRSRGSGDKVAAAAAAGRDAVDVHTLDEGYPIRALVYHTLGKDLEAVGEVIEKCVNFLVEENTPHTIVFSTGRAFLLPRQPLVEPPFAVVPGFPEVSGEIIVTKEEDFRTISADDIFEWWRTKISVSADHFDRIAEGCLN